MTIHILAAVAEHEALLISQRTKAALAAAKARGVVLGGDRGKIAGEALKGQKASAAKRGRAALDRAHDLQPVIRAAKKDGAVTLRQIADALNSKGLTSPRGGGWSAAQVRRVLRRLEAKMKA